MKKHFYVICFALIMALLLVGCQKGQVPPNVDTFPETTAPAKGSTGSSKADSTKPAEIIGDAGINAEGKMDGQLKSFEKMLGENGLVLNDKAVKDAASIGAVEGYGFNVNGAPLEVYLFDAASSDEKAKDNLKTAEESGYITIFGVEINGKTPKPKCTFHDSLVLIFPTEDYGIPHPDKAAIIKAFTEIE